MRPGADLAAESANTAWCMNLRWTGAADTNNWIGYMREYGRRLRTPNLDDYKLEPLPLETHAAQAA